MTVTLHAGSAGSGIDYLMKTVASGDRMIKGRDLNGYWSTGGDTPGQWIGTQAAAMGLAGQQVTQKAADAVYKAGVDPTTGKPMGRVWPRYPTAEERLAQLLKAEPEATEARREELERQAQRAGNQTARSFWEQAWSPTKSFSVLWGLSGDKMRARLEEAEEAAFQTVFARMEREVCWTRLGPGGGAQVQANGFLAASFVHRSSRAGDPDYHRHVAISAKVQLDDGRWLALDARPLMRMTVAYSELYQTELEREMYQRFGILAAPREDTIRPDKRPVREFIGVTASMVHLFSQRRQQTEKALKTLTAEFVEREGRKPSRVESYALAQAAALTNRPDKQKNQSIGAERRRWRRQAWRAGYRLPGAILHHAQLESRDSAAVRRDLPALDEVAAHVLEELEAHRESWTRANAEAEVYRQLTASGWHLQAGSGFDQLAQSVTDHVLHPERCELISPPELVAAPSPYRRLDGSSIFVQVGNSRYTSHRIKGWEQEIKEATVRPTSVRQLTPDQVDAALRTGDADRGFTPTAEQRDIVHAVFTGDTRALGIIGRAGTGKTTIMRLVKEVADAHGIEVLGLAGGQLQADQLAESAGIRAENIARWLTMSRHYGDQQRRWTLPSNAIVIVDEAGQASTPDLYELLRQVEEAGGRLLPTGDPRQLGSPGVGGALAYIESDGTAVHLHEVRRFRSANGKVRKWEVDAAQAIAEGDADASWEAYHRRGRLHAGSLDEMMQAAYGAWKRDMADGLSSILIAPTNALAAQLSSWARTDRVAAGLVDERRTVLLSDGNVVGAGDQIVTRVNRRDLTCEDTRQFVRNGDIWTVKQVDAGALLVAHAMTGGRLWLPVEYVGGGGVELGYAITKDRAQGASVHTGHGVLVEGMDANAAYPEMTRGAYTNHGYIVTEPAVNVETGEPGAAKTARQVWASIVARDGTQLSATARQRQLWDEAEAIRTHVPTLRYALDDIADSEAQEAIIRLLPHVGEAIVTAPAWPALRSQLLRFADEGIDTDALVLAADASRAWTGEIRDHAKILHSRNRRTLRADREAFRLAVDADRPSTAPTYEDEPRAVGNDVIAALGLRLPRENGQGDHGGDDRHAFVWSLAQQIQNRATHLADTAKAAAAAGQGWAVAYGPDPSELADAVEWHDRIQAAAAYRDLANYTGSDATGPAPTADEPMHRGLWRAAQVVPDEAEAAARADAAARSGASWMDAIGTSPPADDPSRTAWVRAAAAIETYRTLWEYGSESAATGPRPTDVVQAQDHDTAREAVAAYRLVRQHPDLGQADPETLSRLAARGDAAAQAAATAAAALATYHRADLARVAADQAAEDAANRVVAAREQAREQQTDAPSAEPAPGHLIALQQEATRAQMDALHAQRAADHARLQVERTAPGAVKAREEARQAQEARRQIARRAVRRDDGPDTPPQPAAGPDWTQRPHGDLSDAELISIAANAAEQAVQIEEARQAMAAAMGPKGGADPVPEQLRTYAAALRAESRTRALMDPAVRTREADERAVRRAQTADERLRRAYAELPGTADRSRRTPPSPGPATSPSKPPRRRPQEPARPPRGTTEERLNRAYADRGPEALDAAKRPPKPATPKTPPPVPDHEDVRERAQQLRAAPQRRARSTAARLEAAYDRDADPRTGKKAPQRGRRQPPPPPQQPRGPSI
ncbi:MobF family relaxase [Streptomyces chrestomyceticus]|uniref:MobF family relaxase n=1 Tax=Streptomyces chrestomyceticus TaxID=68185 RepID=UPI0033D81FC8